MPAIAARIVSLKLGDDLHNRIRLACVRQRATGWRERAGFPPSLE